jgi:1-acyl-sn-glycerol-3-phosphate acyltransferase
MAVIVLRSLVFAFLFYAVLVLYLIAAIPTLVLPRGAILAMARAWARSSMWLQRIICGTRIEWRGLEHLPQGPLLIASKHQSMWETFALLSRFEQPIYILKKELLLIPFFGWYAAKSGMIGVDRKAGGRALIAMTRLAAAAMREGRQLIVFPEGTRRPIDAPPDYKPGFAQIYHESGAACVPVALNSGLFWPRRDFMRYPGTLIVQFLPPVPPGLARRDLVATVADRIEEATARLVAEARAEQMALFGGVPRKSDSG